jgi:AcrR family transcriptional regulator
MARIERSRKYISDALLYLLKKNKYQDISINDIITKAGVSRMTFYRQFYDKKEVLKYILDTRTDEYIANHLNNSLSIEERILQGVTMILERKELAKIIIEADLYYLIVDEFARAITTKKNYYNSFLIGGLTSIFYYYISENRNESAQELADIIIKTLDIETLKEELEKRK